MKLGQRFEAGACDFSRVNDHFLAEMINCFLGPHSVATNDTRLGGWVRSACLLTACRAFHVIEVHPARIVVNTDFAHVNVEVNRNVNRFVSTLYLSAINSIVYKLFKCSDISAFRAPSCAA